MTRAQRLAALVVALILGVSVNASAQLGRGLFRNQAPPPPQIDGPDAYGLNTPTVVTMSSLDFRLLFGTPGPMNLDNGSVSCATGECLWVATLRLPAGASIRALNLSACDSDGTATIEAGIAAGPRVPGDVIDVTPFVQTGGAATPGCNSFDLLLPSPVTVDNANSFYVIQVGAQAGTNVEWNQLRVRYRLQVSPAPGTATFTDVPVGHPQRQFIEALVASGVTTGCGGGNYCPDAPLTRGQMAVFLAAALGLHWVF